MNHAYENGHALSPTSLSPPPQQQHHLSSTNQDTLLSSNNNNNNMTHHQNAANANSMMCFAQLQDDANHKHCSTGNQKALLSETLNRLGTLSKELEETDWMFEHSSMMDGGGTGGGGTDGGGYRGIGLEERHFSFGRRL